MPTEDVVKKIAAVLAKYFANDFQQCEGDFAHFKSLVTGKGKSVQATVKWRVPLAQLEVVLVDVNMLVPFVRNIRTTRMNKARQMMTSGMPKALAKYLDEWLSRQLIDEDTLDAILEHEGFERAHITEALTN